MEGNYRIVMKISFTRLENFKYAMDLQKKDRKKNFSHIFLKYLAVIGPKYRSSRARETRTQPTLIDLKIKGI